MRLPLVLAGAWLGQQWVAVSSLAMGPATKPQPPSRTQIPVPPAPLGAMGRREAIWGGLVAVGASLGLPKVAAAEDEASRKSPRPYVWRIDFEDPPVMTPFPKRLEPRVINDLANQNVLFFGRHEGSTVDGELLANIISRLRQAKGADKLVLGMEDVQQQHQAALDAYVGQVDGDLSSADVTLAAAAALPEDLGGLAPVLHLARTLSLPCAAMGINVDSRDRVRTKGLDGLTGEERKRYVENPQDFVSFARQPGFVKYSERILIPEARSYVTDKASLGNFVAGRILRDEALATSAVRLARLSPQSTVVVVQGLDSLKFGFGSSGRAQRLEPDMKMKSVLLNPTAPDTVSSVTNIRLTLAYAEKKYDGKPLADYVWFTTMPKVNLLTHPMNPEDEGPLFERVRFGF